MVMLLLPVFPPKWTSSNTWLLKQIINPHVTLIHDSWYSDGRDYCRFCGMICLLMMMASSCMTTIDVWSQYNDWSCPSSELRICTLHINISKYAWGFVYRTCHTHRAAMASGTTVSVTFKSKSMYKTSGICTRLPTCLNAVYLAWKQNRKAEMAGVFVLIRTRAPTLPQPWLHTVTMDTG